MSNWIYNPLAMLMQTMLTLPAILFSLSMHEYAHALAADRQGDMTPRFTGRLTLNPAAHIDWVGLAMLIFAGFGWAKPVHVNPSNFRNRKYGDILVSVAGPMMNLTLAFIFAAIYSAVVVFLPGLSQYVKIMLYSFVSINCVLFAFNLIPVPPLDGFSLLRPVLRNISWRLPSTLERYGPMILILLLFTGMTSRVVGYVVNIIGGNFIVIFMRLFSAIG